MGSAVEKSVVRGLIIPDSRINKDSLWTAVNTYDTASQRAGIPVAAQSTELVLGASGTITEAYDVRIQETGSPGIDGVTACFKPSAGTSWFGWDAPQAVSGWEVVDWKTTNGYEHIDAVSLQNGWILVCAAIQGGSSASVVVHGRDPDTLAWSNLATVTIQTTTKKLTPCMVALPSGRVLLYYHIYDSTTNITNIAMEYSDDNGDTWVTGSTAVIRRATLDDDAISMRVAYRGGEYCMLRTYSYSGTAPADPHIIQYASSDGGRFDEISTSVDAGTGRYSGGADIVPYVGGFMAVCITEIAGPATNLNGGRIGSAYQPLFGDGADAASTPFIAQPFSQVALDGIGIAIPVIAKPDYDTATNTIDMGTLTLAAADDGTIYMWSGAHKNSIVQTTNNGDLWEAVTDFETPDGLVWCSHSSTDVLPTGGKLIFSRGRAALFHSAVTVNNEADDSIFCTYLGGYTDVTLPAASTGLLRRSSMPWYRNWVAADVPDATATHSGGGLGTQAISNGALVLTAASPQARYYDAAITDATQTTGLVVMARLKVPALADDGIVYIELRTSDTNTYTARVEATTARLRLRDHVAGTTIAQTNQSIGEEVVHVLFACDGNNTRAWYRTDDGENPTARNWIDLGTETALTSAAASSTRIRWGYEGGTASGDGYFYEFHYQTDKDAIRSTLTTQSNPEEISGRPIGTLPVYLDGGLSITASGGPGYRGDEYDIPVTSDYAIENILPSHQPSPRVPWRSATTTASMDIAFDLDIDAGTPGASGLGNKMFGVYLSGINFREFDIQVHDGTNWSTFAQVECSESVSYQRRGNTVCPSTSAPTTGPYILRDELVGGWFEFTGGSLRKIIGNTEGAWIAPSSGKTPTLYLEGVTGAEGTGIATGKIWFPRVLATFLVPTDYWRGLRLILRNNGSAAPADGYFEIGQMVAGPLVIWGLDYENRARNIETNVAVDTLPDGSRRTRVLGPARRVVEFSWPNGVPTRHISGDATADNWIAPSGETYAVAARHDIGDLLHGLMSEINGPATPVVYCPYIETGDHGTYLTMRQMGALYGRIMSVGPIDTVNGDEHVDEFVRIGAAVIEEEL